MGTIVVIGSRHTQGVGILRTSFGDQVLTSLPCLRNRLSGHGQGTQVLEVPKLYAALAVNMAVVLDLFLIQRAVELKPEPEAGEFEEASAPDPLEEDIPF